VPARAPSSLPAPHIAPVRPQPDAQSLERAAVAAAAKRAEPHANYALPPTSLLDYVETVRVPVDPARLEENAEKLTRTLMDYGIDGHVREIRPGPVVTMYEYVPGPGIKLSKIASLADDLAMSMEAMRVRIVAPIPGKGAVGIEIPNDTRETVYLKEIIAHDTFHGAQSPLTMALGKDIEGTPYVAEMARMPHLLVAGATGAGKSVSINAMIMSILFKARPDEVRMIMVDPKMLELSVYEGIPHLLLPVVTDPKKAALALRWATEEMERRYELLSEVGVRGIDGYNAKVRAAQARGEPITIAGADPKGPRRVCEPMPYLLVIVDELADLMMVASREVESSIMRLAQMARAAVIHLILATQRPSVDVLTGVIKANFPTRIAFQVASRHDSRTIIDGNGAEHLLGRGDMLFLSPGVGGLRRVHGAYVSEEEIERTVAFVRAQAAPQYDESILAPRSEELEAKDANDEPKDEMYDQAVAIVAETRLASISMIQRRLRIGYNRAARMVEQMEAAGVVGPADGAKPREVLVSAMSP
jgi:S-DNA-T family DNA segregation ATPase FtsK/SpoIIIE